MPKLTTKKKKKTETRGRKIDVVSKLTRMKSDIDLLVKAIKQSGR